MSSETLILRSVPVVTPRKTTFPNVIKQSIAYILLAFFATLFFSTNSFAAAGPAPERPYAVLGMICGNEDPDNLPPISSWPGGPANFLGSGGVIVNSSNSENLTAYEWYGTAGLSKYYGGWVDEDLGACKLVDQPANMPDTILLGITYYVGVIGLGVLSWALTTSITTDFLVGPEDGVITILIQGLQQSLYQTYLLPVVMLAAAWIGWQGLVKRRGTEAIQGTGWVLLSATAAVLFFVWPLEIARTTDNAIGNVGTTMISAMSSPVSQTGICSLPDYAPEREVRQIQCALWNTFIYTPWASNQFGPIAKESFDPPNNRNITFRAGSSNEVMLSLYFLDIKTETYAEVTGGRQTRGANVRSVDDRMEQWEVFKEEIKKDKYSKGWSSFAGQYYSSGGDGIVALLSALFGTFPLVFFSLNLIFLQVTFIMLMLVGPLFLLAGLVPGIGRRLMLGWVELSASTIIKRLITYGAAGLLLAMIGIILSVDFPIVGNLAKVILIIVAGFVTIGLRRKIMEQYGSIYLGGDQSLLPNRDKTAPERIKTWITDPAAGAAQAKAEGRSQIGGALRQAAKKTSTGQAVSTARRSVEQIQNTKPGITRQNKLVLAETVEEKKRLLKEKKVALARMEQENKWQNNKSMSVSDWKEYIKANPNSSVPRPKNNADLEKELLQSGVPIREQTDPRLVRDIRVLEDQLAELDYAARKDPKNIKNVISSQDQYLVEEIPTVNTSDNPDASAPTPVSQRDTDRARNQRRQVFQNRRANKGAGPTRPPSSGGSDA